MRKHYFSFLVVCILFSSIGISQNFNQLKKVNHISLANETYGNSVDIFDTTAIIGIPGYTNSFSHEGSVYVLTQNQGGINQWDEAKQIIPSDASINKEFGKSVAIYGDLIVIGAPGDTVNGFSSGSSYIFQRNFGGINNWGQIAKLRASDADTFDLFGTSVAVFEDFVAVGSMCNKDSGECSGSVYVFQKDFGGIDNWGLVKKVTASDGTRTDYFGYSVSLDPSILIVGANGGKGIDTIATGAVYVYYKNQGGIDNWGEITKIISSDIDTNDAFGTSVELKNDTLLVGAPQKDDGLNLQTGAAYLFFKNEGGADNWGEIQKITSITPATATRFGTSVSFHGNNMIIGAEGETTNGTESGSISIFNKNGLWQFNQLLFSQDISSQDNFGNAVALYGDHGIIGARYKQDGGVGSGAAYVFVENTLPTITAISDTTICQDDTLNLTFVARDKETSVSNLEFIKASTNTILLDTANIIITGADTSKTLTIIPTIGQSGITIVTIIIKDTLNGMDTLSFMLSVNSIDSIVLNPSICFGDSLLFAGSYIYNEGYYVHTFQNQNGCDSVVELNLNVDTVITDITIIASMDTICYGTNITFTSNVINQGSSPGYKWFVNGSLQVISSTFNTNALSNNDSVYCVLTSSMVCANPNPDTSNRIIVTVFGGSPTLIYDTICTGDFVVIGAKTYDSAGIYFDTITTNFGCDSILAITITEYNTDTVYLSSQICSNDSLYFNGIYLKGAGLYTATLKNKNNCDSVVKMQLSTIPSTVSVAAYAVDSNICPNDSLSLYALLTGGGQNTTFIWRRNGGVVSGDSNYIFPSNLATSGDVFTVEVFSSSACFTNMFSISDTLQLVQRADTHIDIYDTTCDGLGYSFGGQILTATGVYYDTAPASTFCDSITTLHLTVYQTPLAPNIIQIVDTLIADSWFIAYQWFYNGSPIMGEIDSILHPTNAGTYRVEVTDSNGCVIISYPWVFSPSSIKENQANINFTLYPNPTEDFVNITWEGTIDYTKTRVKLLDITGKVHEATLSFNNQIITINIRNLVSGTYILEINQNNFSYQKIMIKQ